ncbi:MAG: DUF3015 family protein [Bacteriovoracia bacterium]
MRFFIWCLIIIPLYAEAFNGRNCYRFLERWRYLGVPIFTGTSQYSTSTGACSAIGLNKEDQAQYFYAFNQDKVLEDIAKSKGEYLASFERILGCKMELSDLRKNYSALTSIEIEGQYEVVRKSCVSEKVN